MFSRTPTNDPESGKTTGPGGVVPPPTRSVVPGRLEPMRRPHDSRSHDGSGASDSGSISGQSRESKKLIVGADITLQGQIASCDRLVVEGIVKVELTDCHTIEIAERGVFTGSAEIESAEISGRYEGSLTVRDLLLICSTGSVTGNIRYGRLEVQPGGVVNGDMKSIRSLRAEPSIVDSSSKSGQLDIAVGSV